METTKEVFEETSGKGTYTEKETWWWEEETRNAVALKRATYNEFQMNKCDANKEKFREANKASRKAVRIAKDIQSWIPVKGLIWCANLPKPEMGDQNISQICLSSTVWKAKFSL